MNKALHHLDFVQSESCKVTSFSDFFLCINFNLYLEVHNNKKYVNVHLWKKSYLAHAVSANAWDLG